MSYAVIINGGKQHKVIEGEVLNLEKIEKGVGEKVKFDQVLMVRTEKDVKLGVPMIKGAVVEGEIVAQFRDDKVRIIKLKRRKHHLKHQGHRQFLTKVKITKILGA